MQLCSWRPGSVTLHGLDFVAELLWFLKFAKTPVTTDGGIYQKEHFGTVASYCRTMLKLHSVLWNDPFVPKCL